MLAVGLSMDAFSLALIYGTLNLEKSMQKLMSIMVGIFHFFMPILGYQIGELILKIIKVKPDILVGIIFIILGIEMILSLKKEEKVKLLTGILSVILFAFTVSIDSFSIGVGFGVANIKILLPCIIFSIISCLFTYIGVVVGNKLSNKFGSITTAIGAVILIILGLNYLF
jgi:putative Mn2+ efflux pump MntP